MCSNLLRHIFVLCADFRGVRRFGLRGDMRMCFQNTIVAGPNCTGDNEEHSRHYNTAWPEFTSWGWLGVTRLLDFFIRSNRRGKRTHQVKLRLLEKLLGFNS